MITIDVIQSPLKITPSNASHIWNIRSSAYTLTDFQYIVDVYFKNNLTHWSAATESNRAARLKLRPNGQGNAMFDLEEIVRTFTKTNVLFTGNTFPYLNYANQVNKVITLMTGENTLKYDQNNLWPDGNVNTSVDQNWHNTEYRIFLGYSYLTGDTVEEEVYLTGSTPDPITIFPGVYNKTIPDAHYSGASITHDGFTYNSNWFQYENLNHLYYDLFRHKYSSLDDDTDCDPREFLTAAGWDYSYISQNGFETRRARRRFHHPDCPIIMSFLDGNNGYFTNDVSLVVARGASAYTANYTSSAFTPNTSILTESACTADDKFKLSVFYLPYNLTQNGLNEIPVDSKKVCFYLVPPDSGVDFNNRISEVMEFYMWDRSCINDPIHLLFLNERGQWDTTTISGKSVERYKLNRNTYRQENSLNKAYYDVGSWQRGKSIYEQEMDKAWECETTWMYENDNQVIKELFMSPEVYIIEGKSINLEDCNPPIECQSCLEEIYLFQRLTPVVINDERFEEKKIKYDKLFQYKFNLEYAGMKRLKTQG